MSKARRSIFTDAMDEVIRYYYPVYGAAKTIEELYKQFNRDYSLKQIYSRTRVLGITAPEGKNTDSEPRFAPKQEIHAQWPIRWGYWIIREYLGIRQKDPLIAGHHIYRCECSVCGSEHIRTQSAVHASVRKGHLGCATCKKAREYARDQAKREQDSENESVDAFVFLMAQKCMPATAGSFDSPAQGAKVAVFGVRAWE